MAPKTAPERTATADLAEAAQLALAVFYRNGVFELSERLAIAKLKAALEAAGHTARSDALTTEELLKVLNA